MDPSTEIRHLPPRHVRSLVHHLEYMESWKRLMAIIPKTLRKDSYECPLEKNNLAKYTSKHFEKIIAASSKMNRDCSEILLHEWGHSGRVRPAIGHLLYLLVKAQLFGAGDYVAIEILGQEAPTRPEDGPAALVKIPEVEQTTFICHSPTSQQNNTSHLNNTLKNNLESRNVKNREPIVPKILISEIPEFKENPNSPFKMPLVIQNDNISQRRGSRSRNNSISSNNGESVSDMIKFSMSTSCIPALNTLLNAQPMNSQEFQSLENNNLPDISALGNGNGNNESNENVPALSILNQTASPNLSLLMQVSPYNSNTQEEQESTSEYNQSSDLNNSSLNHLNSNENVIPNLSILNNNDNSNLNSNHQSVDNVIPNLSILNNNNDINTSNVNVDNVDLPNISLLQNSDKINNSFSSFVHLKSANSGEIPVILNNNDNNNLSMLESGVSNLDLDLPNLSVLRVNTHLANNSKLSEEENNSLTPTGLEVPLLNMKSSASSSRSNCHSPLPNLSLNTLLPHFNYCDIERCTNGFDETPRETGKSLDEAKGRFLGQGGFGSVFLALNLGEKPIAVKKLFLENPEMVGENDTVTKQFRNEVEILSKYKHENLLSLVGYSCDGPTYCLLYDYVSGGALSDCLKNKESPLTWQERMSISLGTAKAIAYLHTAFKTPLVHRDIKSANILLDCVKQPKLCDFGLIKLTQNPGTATKTTEKIGTTAYMSPEAFRGTISDKLDTFSFGVVNLELLTSLPPCDDKRSEIAADLISYVQEVCEHSITPLLDKVAGDWFKDGINFAEELYKIARKCLELKMNQRPTMVEVQQKLVELCAKF